jgi:hypothetical protein
MTMNFLMTLLRMPIDAWRSTVRVLRDRHARLVGFWFLLATSLILGLGYQFTVNSGFGFFQTSCAVYFSEGRIAALLMLTPFAIFMILSSLGETAQWLEARKRGRHYPMHFFWKMAGLGGVLLIAAFILGRC